jgi:hypothetical protein
MSIPKIVHKYSSIFVQLLNHVTENQKQLEHHIKQVQEKQELNRQKLSEDLYQTELELERSITEVLKKTNMHRDPSRLKEMIEAEEKQVQILLALKLEEYRNLRKADVLSEYIFNEIRLNVDTMSCLDSHQVPWKSS